MKTRARPHSICVTNAESAFFSDFKKYKNSGDKQIQKVKFLDISSPLDISVMRSLKPCVNSRVKLRKPKSRQKSFSIFRKIFKPWKKSSKMNKMKRKTSAESVLFWEEDFERSASKVKIFGVQLHNSSVI